jgi:hypothetical protein
VLIVQALAAPHPGRRRRRPKAVGPSAPQTVPVTRLTVTGPDAFESAGSAERWLEATAGDPERRAAAVRSATLLINRGLAALRAEARDPLVQEIGATRALAIRIGFGEGEALADGRWSEARELPRPRRGRLDDIDPQSRVAAVLAGRDAVHPAETLLERARLDLDQGRAEEARLGLRAAREALEADPPDRPEELRERIEKTSARLGP